MCKKEITLLPCPFCEAKAEIEKSYIGKESKEMFHLKYCCGLTGWSKLYETKDELITTWNTRPSPWIVLKSEDDLPKMEKGTLSKKMLLLGTDGLYWAARYDSLREIWTSERQGNCGMNYPFAYMPITEPPKKR